MRIWLPVALFALAPMAPGQSPITNPASTSSPATNANPAAPPPARVSGTVVDEGDGRPLSHVTVCFLDDRAAGTRMYDYCDETDARGSFSVAGLPPGRFGYLVMRSYFFPAEPLAVGLPTRLSLNAGDELGDIKFRLRSGGVITGRVVYADGEPYSGASLTVKGPAEAEAVSNDLGEYRFAGLPPGDYAVQVKRRPLGNCELFGSRPPRIYVDEAAEREAPPLHVDAGQTTTRPDFVMVLTTPRRADGRVVWDPHPLPGTWIVNIGEWASVQAKSGDGSFSFCGLPPGEYTIGAYSSIAGRAARGDTKIRVADEDLKDLEVVPEFSATIRARVEVEDNIPLDLSRVEIYVTPEGPGPHNAGPHTRRQPDGTFAIDELYTGDYRFSFFPLPPNAYLKSINLGGREFVDSVMPVQGGETIDGLVFTVSAKAGTLNGVVKDETGAVVPDAFAVLQPDPRHADMDIHRCVQRTDQNGAFTCQHIAPGKYRMGAWRKIPDLNWSEMVNSSGTPLEIPESGVVAVTVPLVQP